MMLGAGLRPDPGHDTVTLRDDHRRRLRRRPARYTIFEPDEGRVARKRQTPDEIVAKLRQVDVLVAQGQAGALRAVKVTETTYHC